jgi:hypothetical protein
MEVICAIFTYSVGSFLPAIADQAGQQQGAKPDLVSLLPFLILW